ncbi:LacI family DNA-binding transcriptional regulator [Sagittula salina]|uniref:LacI family DNA-binding transcriptional regulator n=1 Tax=Sagittula salina TaxID=2820268 RepID=A0A940MU98_9RHOB|nr:LacI family DNA-binding transcriptional regulator [Sagittula salina]MBP0484778.1 LacI family DNA-binding transcriptional regulator [Sagittula salina]
MSKSGTTTPARATIRTVAADAGVSVAAVSKVLRNAYGVSDGLRDKVQKSIEKLDYRPSTAARGMRGRTYTVGVLLVELRNPFLPSVIDGVQRTLGKANYKALMGVGEARAKIEQSLIDSMVDMRMDGLLLVAPRLSGDRLARHAQRLPMVVIGHHEPTAALFDTVNSDDRRGARIAVEALLTRGHKDVHMISMPEENAAQNVYREREYGYRDAMVAAGLADRIRFWRQKERFAQPDGTIDALLESPDRPPAVFCWSDIAAVELINKAAARGINVPEDLAIIGYDDTPTAALPLIGLSSMDQHGTQIGELAAAALLSRIEGRTVPEHRLIEPGLILRRST